jgi:hypothetical protein
MKKTFVFLIVCIVSLSLLWADSAAYTYKSAEHGVYIIGWSKAGNLAYGKLTSSCGNYGPCTQLSVVIMDMVEDKQVWSHTTGPEGEISGKTYKSFSEFWNGENTVITTALLGRGIKPACSECRIIDISSLREQYGITVEVMTDEDPETPF